MATLLVRNVPEEVVRALKAQAERNLRSMEQEVRELLAGQLGDRASAIEQIKRGWANQRRFPKAREVDAWIKEGRK